MVYVTGTLKTALNLFVTYLVSMIGSLFNRNL